MKNKLKYYKKRWDYSFNRFFSHFDGPVSTLGTAIDVASSVASLLALVSMAIRAGYELSAPDAAMLDAVLRVALSVFFINIVFSALFRRRIRRQTKRVIKWIVDIPIVLAVLAWAYPIPDHPWIPWLKTILYSRKFLFCALAAYSVVDLSYTLSRLTDRRTNPSLILASSFLVFIIIGSLVLMLPKCTFGGISYFDSLFVSASAVCITGLTSVDIPSTFTPMGVAVIAVLVQLGSLGIITFTSFFAMFFTGNTSIYNQLLLRDVIYTKSMNALIPTLLYVLGFTVAVEAAGAVAVFFSIPDSLPMALDDKIVFATFHSMSSFCNAGFSVLPGGMANPELMRSSQSIYVVTSVLIFAGAVGFPILVNFKDIIAGYIHRAVSRIRRVADERRPVHIFDVNTKIVLYTTLAILVAGSAAFFFLEYDNTLAGMSLSDKIIQSVFNSLIPRSAGFASVDPARFLDVTLLIVVVQMVIGGASQSMAGGIKVNTLGAVLLSLRSVLFGHNGTTAFHRTINTASIRRANAVVALAALSLFAYCVIILLLEPHMSAKSVIFEVVSALFTVGSSLGITPDLSDASKATLCTAMFLGRVGIISLLCGMVGTKRDISQHLPKDNIIIN